MTDLTTTTSTSLSAYDDLFEVDVKNDDLSSGVSSGFGIVSIRGSKWRIKKGGDERPVLDATTQEPVASLPVAILQASPNISHIFYEKSYEEGDDSAPDCWSTEGDAPDADAPRKQSASCAICPHAVWGSRTTPAGKKAKRCQDSRRIVIAPLEDIPNQIDGGPLQLRIPAASLKDLSHYGDELKKRGFSYRAVGTRLGFDMDASYPKLTFKAIRPLTDEEKQQAKEHFASGAVDNILAPQHSEVSAAPSVAPVVPVAPEPVSAVDATFEMEEPVVPTKAAASPASAAPVLAAVASAESVELDNDLDKVLQDIEDL